MRRPEVAMILAAGRGERMRPLTDALPKPLLRVRGKPLIERHVEALADAGITRIVINLAWLGSLIRAFLGDGSRYGVSIQYSEESPAGGIFHALPLLQPGPFLVVNGDVLTDYPFGHLMLADGHDAHLVLVSNPPQHAHGDFGLDRGLAVDAGVDRYTFSGIAAYDPAFFAGCTEGPAPLLPLLLRSMATRRCAAELYRGLWEDVGTPARLEALNT
jgi:MurNAc alpha-1-phosphate uridylyltransferase